MKILVFDMDGVLVEVSESYRESIVRTVRHFTGKEIEPGRIQDYKNQGGFNNDFALSQQICKDLDVEVAYDTVVEQFNQFFLGPNGDGAGGLIQKERWMPADGLLRRLSDRFRLAIFTGRVRLELDITLRRFGNGVRFDPTVCTGEIENEKPAPDGLHKIAAAHPGAELHYVGDSVDDSAAAKAAGVAFYGVASAGNPRREDLAALFKADGAAAVVENINELEEVLP